jgi:RHS repeat-associated protein
MLPALSLPKGGGAIRGIGETFSTNPATGTGSLSVPIATSRGRAGFELNLTINYDTGAGNGPFGLGWSLSTPSITRKTDNGLPRYLDAEASDTFVLSGAEELVPVPTPATASRSTHDVQRYRPRVEGLFARIERWTRKSDGDVHWRATTRDNIQNIYGASPSARIADPHAPGTDPQQPARGGHARVFSWLLEETRDDRGNVARYHYKAEDGAGIETRPSELSRFRVDRSAVVFEATAQRYLARIQYGNRQPVDPNDPAPDEEDAWLFDVVFDYGEYAAPPDNEPHAGAAPAPSVLRPWPVRDDPFSSYRAGFEVRTYRLCRRVLVLHRFPVSAHGLGTTPCLVRSTDFAYDAGPVVTYLTSVTQAGYQWNAIANAYTRATLPSLSLGYARPPAEFDDTVRSLDRESLEDLPSGVDGNLAEWVDLDGEGIPGVLSTYHRSWYYKRNHGGGQLAPMLELRSLPSPADLGSGARLSDLTGDGQLDLLTYTPPLAGYFTRTQDGEWEPFAGFDTLPNIDWDDPNLRFLDLDGDGRPDVLITEQDALVWYQGRAKNGFESAAVVTKPQDDVQGPAVVFADGTQSIFLADMSGDGLVDIARVRNGEVCYWPNLGYGRFGRKITLDGSPQFDAADQFDPGRLRFADLDGSGTSDILYLCRDGVAVYLNQSGNSLSGRRVIRSLPMLDKQTNVSVVDVLGRGTSCLVWSSPLPPYRSRAIVYVDPMGGIKPHLLTSFSNNLGAETRIAYAPSTKFYLQDREAGRPWLTRLPFPVQLVEQIERYDYVNSSRLLTRFAYHHGYFDGQEREFGGFACVEQWDTESFGGEKGSGLFPEIVYDIDPADEALNVPPMRTVTWFHTGAWLKGEWLERALAKEYYDKDSEAPLLADTVLPVGLSVKEQHEAARALRGRILRQEIYAEDRDPASDHPYLVSERNYAIRLIQQADRNRHAIVFAHSRETIDLTYERNASDPRLQHELVLAVDEFGNITEAARVAYPRRTAPRLAEEASAGRSLAEQARLWVTVSNAAFMNEAHHSDWYRVGVPVETATWELTGLEPPETTTGTTGSEARRGALAIEDVMEAIASATDVPYEEQPGPGYRRRLIDAQYMRFLDDNLAPLPIGKTGSRALQHETYRLALTRGLIAGVLDHDIDSQQVHIDNQWLSDECRYVAGTDIPLDPGRQGLVSNALKDAGWWAPSGHVVYDDPSRARALFYQPEKLQDPFGQAHTALYDDEALLIRETRDPVGNTARAENDYRLLAPWQLTDQNGNRTAVGFDALGMVVKTAAMGKAGAGEGDTLDDPTTALVYDLHRWTAPERRPAFVKSTMRERHRDPATKRQELYTYSDGSGREIMRKMQAAPGMAPVRDGRGHLVRDGDGALIESFVEHRWIGTGRTVFDSKGNPVKKYEPFFSSTAEYEDEKDLVESGVTPILRYDPLGRLIRVDQPHGAFSRVLFGSWSQESWDENDTVLESLWYADRGSPSPTGPEPQAPPGTTDPEILRAVAERRAAWLAAQHARTPAVSHLDSLGRVFLEVAHNRIARDGTTTEEHYTTRITLDIDGYETSVTDARGVVVLRQDFDLAGRLLHTSSPDAGDRWTLLDAGDKPLRSWNSRGQAFRRVYDAAQRPTHAFVSAGGAGETLVQRLVYGDADGSPGAANNLRGQVYRDYDGAGVVTNVRFDFQGNLTETTRRLTRERQQVPEWTAIGGASMTVADIAAAAEPFLEAEEFTLLRTYDALKRIVTRTTPEGSETTRSYDESNLLQTVNVRVRGASTSTSFIADIDYNARGQRVSVTHGNGVRTDYGYDRATFRLTRITTVRGGNDRLQNLSYHHDPVGNVAEVGDGAQPTLLFDGEVVEARSRYQYDAVYWLSAAHGREHPGQQPTHEDPPRKPLPHPQDTQALRRYSERYFYDAAGNIERVAHDAGSSGWNRRYAYDKTSSGTPRSDRLTATSVPGDNADGPYSAHYQHDAHGNMTRMPHLSDMRWDVADRLVRVDLGGGGIAYYSYDANGERIRKVVARSGIEEERLYLGGYEIFRRRSGSTLAFERQTLHVLDGKVRVALVETTTHEGNSAVEAPASRQRYQLDNHLRSSLLELDDHGLIISYEEYFPFGGTAYHAARSTVEVSAKRYRYHARERDEETGLDYRGARYYAAWLGRWTSADPAGLGDGSSLYAYVRNNPIRFSDPDGTRASDQTDLPQLDMLRSVPAQPSEERISLPSDAPAATAAAARPSLAPTTGPSRSGTPSASASIPAARRRGVLGFFEKIAAGLRDAASWMREWLPGLIAAPLAGLVDILAGFVRMVGGLFSWKGNVVVEGLRDMGLGALSIIGLKEALTESWRPSAMAAGDPTTSLPLPQSYQQDVRDAAARIPDSAPANGMHAWHAATNAAISHRVGPVGVIPLLIAGVVHESPIDWGSFMAEQESQGTINHILDSFMDIIANIFGALLGLLLPRKWAIELGAVLGNHIPGPGDPNPRGLPGVHGYAGKPSRAWGQYP